MRHVLLFVLGWLLVSSVKSQDNDTTYLQEVSVYGVPTTTHATGLQVHTIQAGDEIATLADKLLDEPSVYLKSYGNGQLSTISFRGTTSSQTAVLWNGMNIGMPTLGLLDFSLVPLFLLDEVSIQPGAGSALYGSDAIGGTILVGQKKASYKKGWNASLHQEVGSFGLYGAGIKFSASGSRFESRSKVFIKMIENDFPYYSSAVGYEKRQNNAAVKQYGFNQDFDYKISQTQELSLDFLYTHNFRENQPAVTNSSSDERIKDNNGRVALSYLDDSRIGIVNASLGFAWGEETFDGSVYSVINTNQLSLNVDVDRAVSPRASIRYGTHYVRYGAASENFSDDLDDNRIDGYISFKYLLTPRWTTLLGLRQSFYQEHRSPFVPSLGTEYALLKTEQNSLTLRGQVARGFRVPSLNDRYWIPGGNPDIKPENAVQGEVGLNMESTVQRSTLTFSLTGFVSSTHNMIVWRPDDGEWSPQNFQKVNISGLESSVGWRYTAERFSLFAETGYTLTRSINKIDKGESDQSTADKQLPYVPIHNLRASVGAEAGGWKVATRFNFTSRRYTNLDNYDYQSLDPYAFVNAFGQRTWHSKQLGGTIKVSANNLFDVYYESYENHAMPGRNYSVELSITINK